MFGYCLVITRAERKKKSWAVLSFVSVCICILLANGLWFLGKQALCKGVYHLALLNISQSLPVSEAFEVQAILSGAQRPFSVDTCNCLSEGWFWNQIMIPPKCSCELNSSLPLNRSLKILDTILNYLFFYPSANRSTKNDCQVQKGSLSTWVPLKVIRRWGKI